MTLSEVSEATGIAQSNLSRMERSAGSVRSDTLLRIADALNADIAFIPRDQATTLEDVRRWAMNGRRVILSAGLSTSDPSERLRRKAALGLGISVETESLAR
jgi:transcriptional regulator with XRE-family HTH domain